MAELDPNANAFALMASILRQWGLSELEADVRGMLVAGDSAEIIPLKLRETEPYKKRFKGNLDRIAAGLPALSEAEFLATETALKSVVRRYVGAGTYDTQDNLNKWIAADLSPQELNDRLGIYQKRYLQQPDSTREAWSAAGFTPADAIKVMMDPKVDETALRRQADIYGLGGAAFQAYKDPSALNRTRLADLVDRGVNVDDAAQGFRKVAGREEYEGFLARTAGVDLSREEQESAELLDDAGAQRKRKQVLDTDQARYSENYLGGVSALTRSRGTY